MSLTPPQTTDKRVPPTPRPRETRLFETSEVLQRPLPLDRFQHFKLFGETGTAAEAAASSPRVPVRDGLFGLSGSPPAALPRDPRLRAIFHLQIASPRTPVGTIQTPKSLFEQEEFMALRQLGYQFDDPEPIGSGMFGQVWKCRFDRVDKKTGTRIQKDLACKRIDTRKASSEVNVNLNLLCNDINDEIRIQLACRHANVTEMHYSHMFWDKESSIRCLLITTFIFTELCDGDLKKFKTKMGDQLTEEQAMRWFVQIAHGLQYLQHGTKYVRDMKSDGSFTLTPTNQPVNHHDLHAGNIFYKQVGTQHNYVFKIADFGLAKLKKPEDHSDDWEDNLKLDVKTMLMSLLFSVVKGPRSGAFVQLKNRLQFGQSIHGDKNINVSSQFADFMVRVYYGEINHVLADSYMEPFNGLYSPQGILIEPGSKDQ